jgi:hypothetical protein
MLTELAVVSALFTLAVILVLGAGYVLGWGRSFGSARLMDRVDSAATLVCRSSVVLLFGGMLIAFAGYALDQEAVTRVGAVAIAIALPLIVVAEHWGGRVRPRV